MTTGLPRTVVYGLFRALPGEPACLPPSPSQDLWSPATTWRLHGRTRTTRLRRPRTVPHVYRPVPVHRIPHHVRDDAYAPCRQRNGREETTSSEKTKDKYFCAPILNATTILMRFTKFDFPRTRRLIAFAQGRVLQRGEIELICPSGALSSILRANPLSVPILDRTTFDCREI